ncbi:DNA replication/repair protein RecF [Sphingomonas sp. HF-S4]|uniref:DNA replication and repair protein RecF n=1 Tax=Sphingomonas agrestis TaxID=3080540 RepID=A0ABU3Y8N3_9SPHN|nr:DNA replication/repair protein RecF [Sphingomonas sp. HF-S4]MDV3457768.1 DNA replication/repair protein RecF [Sphingomonas sp. HF-S4]
MAVTRLVLTDFRNHRDAVLAPGPGFVVLTGENGAGKTNVLEAVSLLAPGRGLRRAPLSEMVRQGGTGGFGVAADLLQAPPLQGRGWGWGLSVSPSLSPADSPHPNPSPEGEGLISLGTGTQPDAPERRLVRINGATAAAAALAEWVTVLWLTPAMDRLFVEGPGERRRFLDRLTLALAPGHAHHSTRYEAAMRQRNRLLADDAPADPEWLTALEARMAEHGAAIDAARRDAVNALAERLAAQPETVFARAGLAIEGWQGDADTLARELRDGRRRDAAAGRTLSGPHRADLLVTHLGKHQPAHLCSTGEQKALLLGLVLAHAELVADRVGRAPILLLDEVAAHLDPGRRAALFERLAGGGQVWMTGTEPELFEAVPGGATRYTVTHGTIDEARRQA